MFKLALIQLKVTANKSLNLSNATAKVLTAAQNGANIIVLPECFNSPYGTAYFHQYAESFEDSETLKQLKSMAIQSKAYIRWIFP